MLLLLPPLAAAGGLVFHCAVSVRLAAAVARPKASCWCCLVLCFLVWLR